MPSRPNILASAQAQFPKSAGKTVLVAHAWRREDSTLEFPEANGSDGWTSVGKPATYEVVKGLQNRGFTVVDLQTSGVAQPFQHAAISRLL